MQVNVISIRGNKPPLTHDKFKYIDLLGVELEGAWKDRPDALGSDGSITGFEKPSVCHTCNFCSDLYNRDCEDCQEEDCDDHCSEDCDDHCLQNCENRCSSNCIECGKSFPYIGEARSSPLTIEELNAWIMANHPDDVNKSCGLHVHTSFKNNTDYMRLMCKDFYDYFVQYMQDWGKRMKFPKTHEFWKRLNGENYYCCKAYEKCKAHGLIHTPESQVTAKKDSYRYCQINFCHETHGTIECRLFSAFKDPQLILSAVDAITSCYENFLDKAPKLTEEKFVLTITAEDLIELATVATH
jgi:hypothetical protein